jgi:hypothetical protein
VALARQLHLDDLVVVIEFDANQRADGVHVLHRCLQAVFHRLMRDVDIVRPNESRRFFRHLASWRSTSA